MIGGKVREQQDFGGLKVGLFAGQVIAINPSREEYKEVLGIDLKEDSRATDYLGESKEGNTTLLLKIWVKDIKSSFKQPITFFLENKVKTNKDGTKTQFINSVGTTSWADEEENLPVWFKVRDYRKAFVGEEELYKFLQMWLGKLDLKDAEAVLQVDFKKLMKGNVEDLRSQINGAYSTNVVSLATVKTVEKDGESKEYQGIYNRGFLPEYSLKQFRLLNYQDEEVLSNAKRKQKQAIHEKFALQVTDSEFGCKDFFVLKDLKDYDANENVVSSNKPLVEDDPSY